MVSVPYLHRGREWKHELPPVQGFNICSAFNGKWTREDVRLVDVLHVHTILSAERQTMLSLALFGKTIRGNMFVRWHRCLPWISDAELFWAFLVCLLVIWILWEPRWWLVYGGPRRTVGSSTSHAYNRGILIHNLLVMSFRYRFFIPTVTSVLRRI